MKLLITALTIVITFSSVAAADPACGTRIDARNLVPCALLASASVAGQTHAVEAAHARELAVSPLLPSNPELGITLARRTRDSAHAFNWSATLSQELEIGG